MEIIPKIDISEYDYILPDNRIAKYPLTVRESSKMLVYCDGQVTHARFKELINYLNPNDLIVFNNTKVVQARIRFKKTTGATIEVFLLEPIEPADYALSFSSTQRCKWKCIVGNLKRWKNGVLELKINNTNTILYAEKVGSHGEGVEIVFSWNNNNLSFAKLIELCGEVPIPPYLNRKPIKNDKLTYQTVYAQPEGSVAAPTAGLHFTPNLVESIKSKRVNIDYVTLHVGAGTFKPVKTNYISDHEMHTEHFFVDRKTISNIKQHKGSIISVGTTTLRTLESLYWLGVKTITGDLDFNNPFVGQWEPYNIDNGVSLEDSLDSMDNWLKKAQIDRITASTQLCIVPGYHFRVVDRLITNYHQPRSTLLLLVAAFIGEQWKSVYQYALENDFRFLSYGDSSLLYRSINNISK